MEQTLRGPTNATRLDGQQRLTSLLIGLRGSFTVRTKYGLWCLQIDGRPDAIRLDVSVGSSTDLGAPKSDFPSCPVNGHRQWVGLLPKSAINESHVGTLILDKASRF
jgi:hypothetical protein